MATNTLIPMPNLATVEVTVNGKLALQEIITTFFYQCQSTPDPANDYTFYLDTLQGKLAAVGGLLNLMAGLMPNNYSGYNTRLQIVAPQRLRFKDYGGIGDGTYAAQASTPNVAQTFERFGRSNGRRSIGRVTIPIPDTVFSGGNITNAPYNAQRSIFASNMAASISTTTPNTLWYPVVFNPNASVPVITIIDGAQPKTTVRTMHRRTVGLGI